HHPKGQLSVLNCKDEADWSKDLAHQPDPNQESCDVVLDPMPGDDQSARASFGIREGHLQVDQTVEADDHTETRPDQRMRWRAQIERLKQRTRGKRCPQAYDDVIRACENDDASGEC